MLFESIVVIIDVNKFKHINDTYGHLIRDAVLKKIADILSTPVREGDIVVRYGRDEFLLLLRNCNMEMSKQMISQILRLLKDIREFDFPIEVLYGSVEIREKDNLVQIIKEADEKMYELKKGSLVKKKEAISYVDRGHFAISMLEGYL